MKPTHAYPLPAAFLLAAHACAGAQALPAPEQQTQPMQQVNVSANAVRQREQSTTTAIVVTREEIQRQGDDSLIDVLKRQSGITIDGAPGRGSGIRMRGMGAGYVAILLNGTPAPAGFALESISPDLVERIEILRVPTAELTGRAMAGAINIVLRKSGAANGAAGPKQEFRLQANLNAGHLGPSVLGQRTGRLGPLAYTVVATANRKDNLYAGTWIEEGVHPALKRRTAYADRQIADTVEVAPRLDWQGASDTLSSQSYLRWNRVDNDKRELESVEIGSPTRFAHARQTFPAHGLQGYADLGWTRKLDGNARLNVKLSGLAMRRGSGFVYRGMDQADRLLETHLVDAGPKEREFNFTGAWRRPILEGHALALGWEMGAKRRDEFRREHQFDANGTPLLSSDEAYRAKVRRSAFFVQDEWDWSASWSAYLGLRREDLRTTGEGNAHAAVDVHAGVWSPIAQALYKIKGEQGSATRDQFRLAVSRTYKAPEIAQLMPRRFTVDDGNSANNPDQQGNPKLRPELAFGVDLAWERYIGDKGMVGVTAFAKRIRDITLDHVFESGGVWVVMPDNMGNAGVRGLEFEARGVRGALAARMNLSRNWSHLDRVAGPDSHLAGQPAYSGTLGLDLAPAWRGIDLGGSWSYRGRTASRQSALPADYGGIKRQLDLYGTWRRGQDGRLKLSVTNLLHQNYAEWSVYTGEGDRRQATAATRTRATWRLVWEQKL